MVHSTRTCIGCRQRGPAVEMARLRAVGGEVFVESVVGRGVGRGASLHRRVACFEAAQKTGAFARAFKRAIAIADPAALLRQLTGPSAA